MDMKINSQMQITKNTQGIQKQNQSNNQSYDKISSEVEYAQPSAQNYRAYTQNITMTGKTNTANENEQKFIELREALSEKLEPKRLQACYNDWDFYTNSTDENRKRCEQSDEEYYGLYRDRELYEQFKAIAKDGIEDTHLNKQLRDVIKAMENELETGKQMQALRNKEAEIAAKYNSYVPMIDGKKTSKAEISKLLQEEKDVSLREKAYNAKIIGGDLIADDLVELVKMRNEFAKSKGYNNFFEYSLKETYDVDVNYLQNLLDDFYEQAKDINSKLQTKNKEELAQEYGIDKEDLKAYHYGLLLDSNPEKEVNKSLKSKEQVVDIAKQAYLNMGYDVEALPIILDLFPRENKNTHGFCFDIEAGKDARILANLTNDSNSIDTLCHELGHCVYTLGIDTKMPFFDKDAYPAMTEAIAMMMGDLQYRENILADVVPQEILEKFKSNFKNTEAKFINRSMQIIEFEKSMYENPDQDLGKLWHDLKCKYTGANESENVDNEWATIPHYLSHPGYYQNYFRANLMKAQMYNHLTQTLGNITENENTAQYLDNNLFRYGVCMSENELIEKFTKEPLSAKALCDNLK